MSTNWIRHSKDEAEKDWQVQLMAALHQQVVSATHTHAGLIVRRACSDHPIDMNEMGLRILHASL